MGHRALTLSVLAHAALLAAIAHWLGGLGDAATAPRGDQAEISIDVVPPPPAAPAPPATELEVALLDGSDATAAPPAAASASRVRAGTTGAGAETAGGPATTGPATNGGDPAHDSALAMRGRRHDLALSGDALSRIMVDRPLAEPVKPSGYIEPAGGGAGRINDLTASYVVHPDGTMSVTDRPDIDLHWRIPLPSPSRILRAARNLGKDWAAWAEDPYRDQRAGTWQDLPRHIQAVPGACDQYGDPMCESESSHDVTPSMDGEGSILGILGGRFDLTGYLARKFVGDPYASRKRKILDATRAERVERGTAFRAEQLGRSAELTTRNLEALWAAITDPAARREALFDLWDECVEGDGPAGAAGARARAMVIGWITSHLPQGQPGAYSADDLARLDARRSSKQHFAPY